MKRLAKTVASVTFLTTATITYLPNRAEAITFNSGGNTFGSFVSGMLPIDALASVAQLESLKFAKPAYKPITNVGKTTSQANVALRADVAREQFGVDGTGVTIGVLSDSFNFSGTAAEDVASGDLPSGINVLKDLPNDGSLGED
ncbi:MAG: hypothetical protein ACOC07_11310, partial [Coleofasciculus sp.]